MSRGYRLRLIVVLGSLAAFGPLSIDMYLPAFPAIADDLDAASSQVQLTLTGFLVGLAVGQLVAGSVSDQLGRRLPLLVGLVAYVIASLLCALAPSIGLLTFFRFLQGLSGAAGVVMSRAIVRDFYTGAPAARFFSRLMLVNGIAPIVAPTIGGAVLRITSWHGVFVVLAAIGFVVLVACAAGLRESLPPELRRAGGLQETVSGFGELLRHRVFLGYTVAAGLSLGSMFAYIGGSAFVLQDVYDLTPQQYALSFGVNALGIGLCGQVSGYLVGRVNPRTILVLGLGMLSCGAVALLAVVLADGGVAPFLAALFATVAGVGFVLPNATALALSDHPHLAGSASALLGVAMFLTGAVAAPLVGIAGPDTALPMALVMVLLTLGALMAVATMTRPPVAR